MQGRRVLSGAVCVARTARMSWAVSDSPSMEGRRRIGGGSQEEEEEEKEGEEEDDEEEDEV